MWKRWEMTIGYSLKTNDRSIYLLEIVAPFPFHWFCIPNNCSNGIKLCSERKQDHCRRIDLFERECKHQYWIWDKMSWALHSPILSKFTGSLSGDWSSCFLYKYVWKYWFKLINGIISCAGVELNVNNWKASVGNSWGSNFNRPSHSLFNTNALSLFDNGTSL